LYLDSEKQSNVPKLHKDRLRAPKEYRPIYWRLASMTADAAVLRTAFGQPLRTLPQGCRPGLKAVSPLRGWAVAGMGFLRVLGMARSCTRTFDYLIIRSSD
jgi:hypothetical protein